MVPPNYGGMWALWNYAVSAMAMARLPTTSCWCQSIDTRSSMNGRLKRIASWSSARRTAIEFHAMEIVEDHVHLFLEFHPTISLSKVVQYLKGSSSYRMFKRHPELKKRYRGGSLWSSGKFFRSVGNVTADTISHYINESQGKQKAEHQLRKPKASGQLRLDDFWIPKNRARGPKHTPSFRAGWPRAVDFFSLKY